MTKGNEPETGQLGGEENSVLRLMGQMMRLPFTALVYSFEILVRTVRGMQRMADQGFETLAGESTNTEGDADRKQQTTHEEEDVMWNDQDLSGNDLKYVSYSILFTKRDLEATLEEQKQDLVNYPTNGGSYGGLKLAKFFQKVATEGVPRPQVWKENNYPDSNRNNTHWTIPEEDQRYITFIYTVDRRIPREDKEYDRDQVRALRDIREGIDNVGNRIG
jgi:hypothetical protein